MKNLYLIGGTMGVGKTTVSRYLNRLLPASVMLDGDWCWMMDPFVVNDETKAMVTDNICHLLNSFLRCGTIENVVFCWVMHEQAIIDGLLERLDTDGCRVHTVSLVCSEDALCARLQKDVDAGIRTEDVIARSTARLPLYRKLDTAFLDVSDISAEDAAKQIIERL